MPTEQGLDILANCSRHALRNPFFSIEKSGAETSYVLIMDEPKTRHLKMMRRSVALLEPNVALTVPVDQRAGCFAFAHEKRVAVKAWKRWFHLWRGRHVFWNRLAMYPATRSHSRHCR